ncbi:acyl carrier protein [Paenibacillus xylaniclasticus]|uniref:acyl carrier protein n=1 Tax=Paenibacillus xylaniclasticus TaxID=588083 RepID=UPI000FD7D17B|nr:MULTISPECIES: acyl carrier protein [Paenibacillus]GFN32196.1 hypothetical protein PCURB6_24560 [Paenibacillus curdlanolyticus]
MELEEKVVDIIAAVLNQEAAWISSPKVRDNLELAGMDSINAIQVMVVLEEEYGIAFGEEELLEENFLRLDSIIGLIRNRQNSANRAAEGS